MNTLEGKSSEVDYVTNALLANGHPPAVISNVLKNKIKKPSPELIPSPEELGWVSLDLTRLYNKKSHPPSLGLLLNFRPMWCIKSFAPVVPGATLVRLEGVF